MPNIENFSFLYHYFASKFASLKIQHHEKTTFYQRAVRSISHPSAGLRESTRSRSRR
jgi:hypothetical protein